MQMSVRAPFNGGCSPTVREHTQCVVGEFLGLDDAEIAAPGEQALSEDDGRHRKDDSPGDGARQIAGAEHILVLTGMPAKGAGVILSGDPLA